MHCDALLTAYRLLVWVFKEFKYLPAVLNNYGRANLSVACSMVRCFWSTTRHPLSNPFATRSKPAGLRPATPTLGR